ncbi:YceD family protein [Candidatus Viridilinea mediisalina]|uniref:DUF177 domain-containing protein n=1 Tax=Candidatus Viridilinea mediisalina TaxID=2024553 RepID=A0A2A6RM49_9CHLR|nr:DUF177 domain-containing protein [Candidatus Viridilinea mediisalina]PDW04174.1 hypothetical protein CJ255_04925 [Candidatus Viridilinea mediisalina]
MTDLKFNLAQLLREEMGSRRDYEFTEQALPLDEQLMLREVRGTVRFTRTASGVWANAKAQGVVRIMCVRSLEEFDYPVEVAFADQFHAVVDIFTGGGLPQPTEDDPFLLNELHMADIGEALREYTLLALPLNPVSPAYRDQPVSYTVQSEGLEDDDEVMEVAPERSAEQDGGEPDVQALKAWAERHNRRSGRS